MTTKNSIFAVLVILAGMVLAQTVSAETATGSEQQETPAYSMRGADNCIMCHGKRSKFPVLDIFKTKHGRQGDKSAPFGSLQCEACHGPGQNHIKPGAFKLKRGTIIGFKASDLTESAEERNGLCLNCHRGNSHIDWEGSKHEAAELACTSCHTIHVEHDPVLGKRTQSEVCYSCHKQQRSDFFKPSTHPVRAGLISCTGCHSPHGSAADRLLVKPTVNQTCFTCHAEKRGPFLWQHAPVVEDCTLCHDAHGSVYGTLLKKSTTLLCQQCHSTSGHPSVAQTGTSLIGGGNPSNSAFLLAGGCINCHSQIHGSNHPSGIRQMR